MPACATPVGSERGDAAPECDLPSRHAAAALATWTAELAPGSTTAGERLFYLLFPACHCWPLTKQLFHFSHDKLWWISVEDTVSALNPSQCTIHL